MNEMKEIFTKIGRFISIWSVGTLLLALIILPYKIIFENKYITYKMFNIIYQDIYQTIIKSGNIIFLALILMGIAYQVLETAIKKKTGSTEGTKIAALKQSFQKITCAKAFKIGSIAIILILLIISSHVTSVTQTKAPNVIFIAVDTLRSDHTEIGGSSKDTTPYIRQQLMKDSVAFENAYSNSPWTLPSFCSMLTSQYPSQLNVNNMLSKLGDPSLTLAEVLKNHGYVTHGISSNFLVGQRYGLNQGFQQLNENHIKGNDKNYISSPGVTNDAIKFINKNKKNKFFLFLLYYDPHYNYIDHTDPNDKTPQSHNQYKGPFSTDTDIQELRKIIKEKKYTPQDLEHLLYRYDSEITHTDKFIGNVIDELRKHDLYDNTIIVFTGDHGEEFTERAWLGHGNSLYNEQIHVPVLIKPTKANKIETNKKSNQLISNLDLFPTIMDLLNITPPETLMGKSVFSKAITKNRVYSEVDYDKWNSNQITIISNGYKLIRNINRDRYEFYNLLEDPMEKNPLEESQAATTYSKLKSKLKYWEHKYRAKQKINKKVKLTNKELEELKSLGYL
jgi:arylsulfatase A-like enzyme